MKTKVIAFRVNEREYEVLQFAANQAGLKLAEFVNKAMTPAIVNAFDAEDKQRRKEAAKAKRDAKKAAANGVQ